MNATFGRDGLASVSKHFLVLIAPDFGTPERLRWSTFSKQTESGTLFVIEKQWGVTLRKLA